MKAEINYAKHYLDRKIDPLFSFSCFSHYDTIRNKCNSQSICNYETTSKPRCVEFN